MTDDVTELKVNRRPKDDSSDEEQDVITYNEAVIEAGTMYGFSREQVEDAIDRVEDPNDGDAVIDYLWSRFDKTQNWRYINTITEEKNDKLREKSQLLWEKLKPLPSKLQVLEALPLTDDAMLIYADGCLHIYDVIADYFQKIGTLPQGKYDADSAQVYMTDVTNYHFGSIPAKQLSERVFMFIWGNYQEMDPEEDAEDESFYNIHELRSL